MQDEMRDRIDAFKLGFLRKLAEDGITPDEFYGLVKQAFDPLSAAVSGFSGATDMGTKMLGTGIDVGGSLLKNLAYLGLVAPIAIGGTAGAVEARLTSPSGMDVDSLRNAELAAKYEQATKIIQQRMESKRQRIKGFER